MRDSTLHARECISQALILLMKQKPFDDISISEICSCAGYNRAAYYRNFSSKTDILRYNFDNQVSEFHATMTEHRGRHFAPTATRMFRMIGEHSELFLQMHKAGMHLPILEALERAFRNTMPDDFSQKALFYRSFHAGGYFYVTLNWLLTGMNETPEEMGITLAEIVESSTII